MKTVQNGLTQYIRLLLGSQVTLFFLCLVDDSLLDPNVSIQVQFCCLTEVVPYFMPYVLIIYHPHYISKKLLGNSLLSRKMSEFLK